MIKEDKEKTLAGKISDQFMSGIIILAPPAITAFIVIWVLDLTEGTIGREIEKFLQIKFPGIGLISILFFVWIVGLIFGHAFGQKIIHLCEFILSKIPVVKFIYSSVKQFSKAIFESNSAFKRVVIIPYHQSKALGFLMSNVPDAVREELGDEYVCVFVPWSLNMTSGTNLFVKRSDVIFIDMEPEDALQFMLTAGTVAKKKS